MKTKTSVKAGRVTANHNETSGVRVRTAVKAGRITGNHNETKAGGLRIKPAI